jgi:hypothetical protein
MKTRLLFTGYKVHQTVLGWTSLQKKQGRMLAHLHLAFFFVRHPVGVCCGSSSFLFSIESKKLKAKKEKPQPIILARLRVVPHTANRPLPSGLSLAGGGLHSQRLRFLHFVPHSVSCRTEKTNALRLFAHSANAMQDCSQVYL